MITGQTTILNGSFLKWITQEKIFHTSLTLSIWLSQKAHIIKVWNL